MGELNSFNGLALTYVEITMERLLLLLSIQQQLNVVNSDIAALQSVIAQVQAGDYSSVSASGFQMTLTFQAKVAVPAGPGSPPTPGKVTVTNTKPTGGGERPAHVRERNEWATPSGTCRKFRSTRRHEFP